MRIEINCGWPVFVYELSDLESFGKPDASEKSTLTGTISGIDNPA